MSLREMLLEAGFDENGAAALEGNSWFIGRYKSKSAADIKEKLNEIKEAYNCTKEQAASAVLKFLPFAGLDHHRVLNGIIEVYNCTKEQAASAVLKHLQFAGYDHQRVLNGIIEVYNCTKEQTSNAVLKFLPFAGLDHHRVIRQLSRIGRMVGVSATEIKESVINNPVMAGYSAKRYLAAIDVGRALKDEGIQNGMKMLAAWRSNVGKSSYVPGTNRLRITQAIRTTGSYTEPALMGVLRKTCTRTIKAVA